MRKLKGVKQTKKSSDVLFASGIFRFVPIYYDYETHSISTNSDKGEELFQLLRPCTEEEIERSALKYIWR